MLMAGFILNVSAIETTNGILTLTCEQDGFCIASMEWKVYRVGEKRNGELFLTGDFADYPVDLSDISDTDRMTEIASTLNNFAVLDMIEPVQFGKTNGKGVIQFSNLSDGLYLAVGMKTKIGEYTYFPSPIIFEVDGNKHSALNSYPKFYIKRTLPGSKDRFVVRKVWANADGQLIPNVLTVGIYKDGELCEEIQLSQENEWTYSWEGSAASDWRVKEISVPPGCYVMYRNNETQYIVMNAYDNELLARTTTTTSTTSTSTTTTIISNDTSSTSQSTSKTDYDGTASRTTGSTTSFTTTTDITSDTNITTDSNSTTTNPDDTQTSESTTLSSTSTNDVNGGTTVNTTKNNTNSTDKTNNNVNATTTASKLPQTGQLWWPVPLMLFGGLIFVAVGLRLIMESKKED